MCDSLRAPSCWVILAGVLLAALTGCQRDHPVRWQGYLEAEYVYVGSPLAGRLSELPVHRGDRVETGARLFALEREAELAAQRQAADQLRAAEARAADLRKGSRPTELAALVARREQASAAAQLAKREYVRLDELHRTKTVSDSDFDRARLTYEQAQRQFDELSAQVETAQLGGRPDAIAAAEAEVAAARAAKQRADWNVEQKAQNAPRAALIYDTLYRPGEYVNAAAPVVVLLPPGDVKVRFFVGEAQFALLRVGQTVAVNVTGRPPVAARITYLSPQPEYTPPILYNRENRAKLVFMVEGEFDPAVARDLHPGQPVDVAPPAS
jgi:HlyD family secretion protein